MEKFSNSRVSWAELRYEPILYALYDQLYTLPLPQFISENCSPILQNSELGKWTKIMKIVSAESRHKFSLSSFNAYVKHVTLKML